MRLSRLPGVVGACEADILKIAQAVNGAQRRLIMAKEVCDEGWWGSFAEMVFQVDPANPYITTPREVARIEAMTVCDSPVPVQNQFYEYLQFGNGTLPQTCGWNGACGITQSYTKNNVPTFTDLTNAPQLLRAYIGNPADVGRRAMISGVDSNGIPISSQDGYNRVQGQFAIFESPFVTWPQQFNSITGIQKDITSEQVSFYQVDPTSGVETLLLTMQPGEETAWYRRYYLGDLPRHCCNSSSGTVQVKAIVKLEPIDVAVDTDFLVLTNREAIIEEAASIRYSEMDTPTAKQMSRERHNMAIGLLNGELTHYLGTNSPAIQFKPFGSASLRKAAVGMT